jgi:hypothetical protein
LSELCSIGDGFLRCVLLAIEIKLENIIQNAIKFSLNFNNNLIEYFGQLINDPLFCVIFGELVFNHYQEFLSLFNLLKPTHQSIF